MSDKKFNMELHKRYLNFVRAQEDGKTIHFNAREIHLNSFMVKN